ncbi:MAG: hypothetical protein JWP27_846 [Flaviaesturariibacter sp.]|nr:hypothetical protein [Flaviaesturariibacter sp.]
MHDPKLTAYIIRLNPASTCAEPSNRWLFRCLIQKANSVALEDSFIYMEAFRKLLKKLDQQQMYADTTSKKCMTAHQPNLIDPSVEPNIKPYPSSNIIAGRVEGGSFGRKRNKTSTLNKTNRSAIAKDDAITDDFYFLLYTPLDSIKSILLLQSYSDDSIDAVMKKFFKEFFVCSGQFAKPGIERFVPEVIINDFKDGAVISNFTFSSEVPSETLLDEPVLQSKLPFKVTVKIEASSNGLTYDEFKAANDSIQRIPFARRLTLGIFSSKKGSLKDKRTGKTTPFDISDNFEIQPTIQLSKYLELTGGPADFALIHEYCIQLLESIKLEIYMQNAVQER